MIKSVWFNNFSYTSFCSRYNHIMIDRYKDWHFCTFSSIFFFLCVCFQHWLFYSAFQKKESRLFSVLTWKSFRFFSFFFLPKDLRSWILKCGYFWHFFQYFFCILVHFLFVENARFLWSEICQLNGHISRILFFRDNHAHLAKKCSFWQWEGSDELRKIRIDILFFTFYDNKKSPIFCRLIFSNFGGGEENKLMQLKS